MKMPLRSSTVLGALIAFWLVAVTAGTWLICDYDHRPGNAGSPPASDPIADTISLKGQRVHLVMVVHPQCACTRASLDELALLMARSQGSVRATVVFVRYAGMSRQWAQSGIWHQAAGIPGVQAIQDSNGSLARRLGATTSGETYLYDGQGHLLFAGGITGARGETGDNAGYASVLALIQGRAPVSNRSHVFGCSLFP